MKFAFIGLVSFLCFFLPLKVHAQNETKKLGATETNWPGIQCQIIIFKRIPPNRLLVVVRLFATPQAPPGGTLIGYAVPVPPNANKNAPPTPLFRPSPFSLASSTMTDDKTKVTYAVLRPVAPPGMGYRPDTILDSLKPNQNLVLTIQFATPPPLPSDPTTGLPPKQTVSFTFTNAKGPITHVTLPPLAPAAGAAH